MNEKLDNSSFESGEVDEMDFGEVELIPKYESSIPKEITNNILQKVELPPELPHLGSSIIEDFIADNINEGITEVEPIVNRFVEFKNKINEYIDSVKEKSESINWEEVFTIEDAKKEQVKICEEMGDMGISKDAIDVIAAMNVEIGEGIGISSLSDKAVYASRLQVVRKAMDYIAVFGTEVPFEQVVKILMKTTIKHELGHRIDKVMGIATNRISLDQSWTKNGETDENKSERFAEFWGNVGLSDEDKRITSREWAIQVSKVNHLWDIINDYNSVHEQKLDLMGIFGAIGEKIGEAEPQISDLLKARMFFYGGNESENYALPYDRGTVEKAVRGE
jgi:hypothetical protein